MTADLFVDANQYLGLFGLVRGKKLLDLLEGQKTHIFVPTQIVEEVLRNKLKLASTFLSQQLKDIAATKVVIPDHLLGIDDEELVKYRKTFQYVDEARSALRNLADDVLAKIGRSEDDVSKRLAHLFDNAVAANSDEIQRARVRKEKGNPPGKASDPLGDQISWEQLLTHLHQTGHKEIWLITRDRDYFVKSNKALLLNPLLNRDLIQACGEQPQVHCYDDLADGLTNFAKQIGVKDLPTEQEVVQIKNEITLWRANTTPAANNLVLTAENLTVSSPKIGSPPIRVTQGSE